LFLAGLFLCIATGGNLLYALAFGALCFTVYARYKGFSWREILRLQWEGVRKLGNILVILCLIGVITGLWRAGGAIPYIVYHAVDWIDPRFFALWAFLLCCLMSLLTGSALCTASIMGIVLMLLARSSGANEELTAGAILAGMFFGDRCSPMSSSANLVCTVTGTKLYDNIRSMLRTSAVPLLITLAGYILLSLGSAPETVNTEPVRELAAVFCLRLPAILPCAAILLLSLLRLDVKITMSVSVLLSAVTGVLLQGMSAADLLNTALWGYHCDGPLSQMLSGGGLLSMLRVVGIITLSFCYPGLIRATGLLDGFTGHIDKLARRLSPAAATVLVSLPVAMVSCNQNFGIILSSQLCSHCFDRRENAALAIENSIVLTAPLIPWNVAFAAPMAMFGLAGIGCLPYALYLYAVPLLYGAHHFLHLWARHHGFRAHSA
jgi:NhaC family Na+:H+ antiporter